MWNGRMVFWDILKSRRYRKLTAVWQQLALFVSHNIARFFHFYLEIEFNALRFINYTIPRLCSTYAVATLVIKVDDSL